MGMAKSKLLSPPLTKYNYSSLQLGSCFAKLIVYSSISSDIMIVRGGFRGGGVWGLDWCHTSSPFSE